MLSPDQFVARATAALARPLNGEQEACVKHGPKHALMIVAGPGSGKTTVLVLRALRHVFVDGFLPEQVLITTFTRKAATEIRSRLLDWGLTIRDDCLRAAKATKDSAFEAFVEKVDVNRFVTGTLDSLCEDWLSQVRSVDEVPPVLVDGFAAKQIFTRAVFRKVYYPNQTALRPYLAEFDDDGDEPQTLGDTVNVVLGISERLVYDLVPYAKYKSLGGKHKQARNVIADAAADFDVYLKQEGTLDFARLERTFLESLQQKKAAEAVKRFRAVLVDEYQDTNPLQEAIYFEFAKHLNPSLTVVGDDDQSLYRFRGSTVELFRDFRNRFHSETKLQTPQVKYLFHNYRSTPEVVAFFNSYITNDPNFQAARVAPPKPAIVATRASGGIPVLGMFRSTQDELATDLAALLTDVFRGGGRTIKMSSGKSITLKRDPGSGDIGDAAFLAHTVSEMSTPMFGNPGKPKFPLMLREACRSAGIQCFNPRGRALRDIGSVQILLGLILECLDGSSGTHPEGQIVPDVPTTLAAKQQLAEWRIAAAAFTNASPRPNKPHTIRDFLKAWQTRTPIKKGEQWPMEWPLLELCFTLISWMPDFQNDPEHHVYLEAITRTITQAAAFSPYRTLILNSPKNDAWKRSRTMIILDVLAPIAENVVEVDEEILPSVPRDRLNFMTVHQAKGLEFPIVIVDVASAFTRNHPKNRFRRFPDRPSRVQLLEAELARCSPIGTLRMTRKDLDRAFEDLIRLYYVAYSRAQDAMVLVGLDKCLGYGTTIQHVATWWRQDANWSWKAPFAGKKPPVLCNKIPLELI